MNRYLLIGAVILACICIISVAYACVSLSIDAYSSVYIGAGNIAYLHAWVSAGGPAYEWNWTWPSGFNVTYLSDDQTDSYRHAWCDTAGIYDINVDADGPNGYDYDHTKVYVIDAEIEDNPPNRDTPEYIAYQTGTNIYYKIEPTSGWTPSEVRLYIKDSSSEIIRYVTLSNGVGEQTAYWDGKNTRGQWAEPGQYTAQIRVRIYSTYIWSDTHTFYILNVQITKPTGTNYDNQFAFDGNDAICVIDVNGATGITALDSDLEWGLEPLGSTFCIWKCEPNLPSDPNLGLGPEVTFWNGGYGGYPSTGSYTYDNGDWGEKTLVLTHPTSGFVDTLDLKIFFDPNVVIISDVPNWFYYWKQGGVVSDLNVNVQYDPETSNAGYYDCYITGYAYLGSSATGICDVNETFINHYYQTAVNTGSDGVCDTNALGDDIQVIDVGEGTVPYAICITAGNDGFLHSADDEDGLSRLEGTDDELDFTDANVVKVTYCIDNYSGIDTVAVLCAHELKHKSLLDPLGAPCTWAQLNKTSDNDCVSNDLEGVSPYFLDPDRKDTYNLGAGFLSGYPPEWRSDNEFLAYLAGMSPGPRDPNKDWSKGGKKWHID